MRIVYLLTTLGIGGAEKQVVNLAERMAARGHSVAFIVLKHSEEEWPVKLPVLRLNMRKSPMGILRGLRFTKGFLALFRPDLIHSHTFPANVFARLLRLMMPTSATTPVVLNTIHNVYEGGWHRMWIYRVTDSLADGVTAVSCAAADRFVRLHAVPARKVSVLTNGIDTDVFASDRKRRKEVRGLMQAADGFIWIAVGRLVAAKDYPNLFAAFAKIHREDSRAQLWIVGEGDRSSFAGQDSIDASGVLLLGLRHDVVALLDAADAYVLSSAWEGLPLALGEAMAMEKPAVATDVGGVRELLGDAGALVPAKDSLALASAMLKVMQMDSSARRFLGRAARSRIETHFSMSAKAEAWEQLYEQMRREKSA